MSTAPKTVVETHSATIVNVSNTDFIVQGSGLNMTFIGGSNDVVSFPQESNDRLIAVNTTNLSVNASSASGLGVVAAGGVIGMHIYGWGNFATDQTLTLFDQGHYTVSINNANDIALISELNGGHSHHRGSITFEDSSLHASQIIAIAPACLDKSRSAKITKLLSNGIVKVTTTKSGWKLHDGT